ncbi:nicotinate-nucleotide--dimethylbenzimidazole phosphoribosyltransferase [Rhizobiales bacterium]|uniref:nicotinate-nucleotide--dimethylbenzimidazole phosphoribosyltransferase n=1 Tax=Hongsoonwoonella zoysiae TaxID=2821844 RepID=UPI00156039A4|nr:nicotinate-nucleotide--dimethylbenzimidazole phosphoribosyltransferase [Hongsoonwoonella zoysiae]NRG18333.1 nicotinate-nucleotide--dimethylbenzimidazole phosphoribosyltransferase [Hongsoonwoonella zoysiae]
MSVSSSALPFEDIRNLVRTMPTADNGAVEAARRRDAQLTKPAGSLGKLEEIAEWLAAWNGPEWPKVKRPLVAIFAANHGVTAKGVSAFPADVTRQMVENFSAGGAAINQICIAHDLGLKVFELALDYPTPDITEEDAFDEAGCAATMAFGMEALAGGTDLICIGEMGIGNTTVASALLNALYGGTAADWVGPGTGVDDTGLQRKCAAVEAAVARLGGEKDPLEILRRIGGREFAAMAGLVLAARHQRIPVIVDGFVTTAAVAVLQSMDPDALDHCIFAHVSAEPAHSRALQAMGKQALFDFGMRLGEGTGAALAAGIVKAAAQVHAGMATFDAAGVSGKSGG